MKLILQKTRIQHLIARRNGYLMLALFSMVLNVILIMGLFIMVGYQKTILVPPVLERPIWVTSNSVSHEYLSGMSLFLSDLLLNVTKSNAPMQHQLFLRYVDSKFYPQIKTNLMLKEEKLQKEHMSMSFQLANIKVDADNLMAEITGDLEYKVGEQLLPAKRLTYTFKFSYRSGLLKVLSFEETKL